MKKIFLMLSLVIAFGFQSFGQKKTMPKRIRNRVNTKLLMKTEMYLI